ncbi:MAG: MerR family transcriptional regulator, partial [Candidatus Omnitrophica bacterium]|nr:MerR family transcriptional regulator [Candidatus Omnitrophota bacterium]
TLIKYEIDGIIQPARNPSNNHRMFSRADLRWIECVRGMVHQAGVNIKAIKFMLTKIPCWALKKCDPTEREKCTGFRNLTKACWEVLQGVCHRDGQTKCVECDVYKTAHEYRDRVTAAASGYRVA